MGTNRIIVALVLAAMPAVAALARPGDPAESVHGHRARSVGFELIRVPNAGEPDLQGAVWYPSTGRAKPERLEGFVQTVSAGGPVAGSGLPLIVMSHGGGGSFAGHYDTAVALARAGYVVAAISHAGDSAGDESRVLEQWRRPAQLSRLLDFMLGGWRARATVDRSRIGAFGFSNGGFAVLVAAGGTPDLAKVDGYCAAHPAHDLCTALAGAGVKSVASLAPPPSAWRHEPRIKAIAAAAPAFGFTFDRAGLAPVGVPVLLWRGALDSHQPSPFYEEHVVANLPRRPEYRVEPGAGHYAFLPPCGAHLRRVAPAICTDRPGFDRAAFHRRLNAALVGFFDRSLDRRAVR